MAAKRGTPKAGTKGQEAEALASKAAARGWRLEHGAGGYRLVDASTGTLVACDWTDPGAYGLALGDIAAVLDG